MTVSVPHNIPFSGISSTWYPQMIFHCFLELFCCFLYCHYGQTSTPRVVCVLGVVMLTSCKGTIRHWPRLYFLSNCPYPGGYFSSSCPKFVSISHNRLTWVETFIETSWCSCHNPPPLRSCWFSRVLLPCIFLAFMLIWLPQIFGSRLWWFHIALVVGRKFSHDHNRIIIPIRCVVDATFTHLDLL